MKAFILSLLMTSSLAFAQDPATYLKNFDAKVYSLKNKGVQNFVVDIESSKLTKQMNDQQLFGKVEELIFRTYWTSNPERLAIEIVGLPEGFVEIKEELKASALTVIEHLLPPTQAQKFNGYKFSAGSNAKEIIAQDSSGIAPIPSFVLKFDQQEKLFEIVGNKPIGTLVTTHAYSKDAFAEGKWVLKELTTNSSENGQSVSIKKELSYGKSQGIGVLSEVEITVEQLANGPKAKPVITSDTVEFKNYKINDGEALKFFLGEAKPAPAAKPTATPAKN